MKQFAGLFGSVLCVLWGCGGGGTPPPAGGATTQAGSMRIEGRVEQPLIASTGTPAVTAVAIKGNISGATFIDTFPEADESEIVASRRNVNGYELVAANPDGSGLRLIVADLPHSVTKIAVSPDGAYVYFIRNFTLHRVPLVGGTVTPLISDVGSFAFVPSGSKVVYRNWSEATIRTANANGTGKALIGTCTPDTQVAGCISESKAVLVGARALYLLNLTPGSTPLMQVSYNANCNIYWTAFSLSPAYLLVGLYDHDASKYWINRHQLSSNFGWTATNLSQDGPDWASCSYAPDGASLLACTDANGVLRCDGNAAVQSEVFAPNGYFSTAWTPFRTSRRVIGGSSAFESCGALFFTELSTRLPCYVTVDAATRSSIQIETLNQGTGNIVFNLSCDLLTGASLAKANGYLPTSLTEGATGLKGIILSFDSVTGQLALAVTYTKRPQVIRANGRLLLSGDGLDRVFDAHGRSARAGKSVGMP